MNAPKLYSFIFSFKNVVENKGDSLIVLYLGWLFLSHKGDICKICKKDSSEFILSLFLP